MNKIKTKISIFFPYLFVILCSFIMVLNASSNPFCTWYTTDSSVFNYVAKVIIGGGMPYRDVFDHKGPLIYLIDVLGLLLNEQTGIWLIEFFFIFVTFLFAYKIAKRLGCGLFTSCGVVVVNLLTLLYYFEGGNLVEEYACTFITISLYFFLKFFLTEHIKKIEIMICGASLAAVCLLRINMITLWVVMCVAVLFEKIKSNKWKDIICFTLWFSIGIALVTMPIMIWLIKNNSFTSFIQDYFIFNFMYTSNEERASIGKIIEAIVSFSTGSPMLLSIPTLVYSCIYKRKDLDFLIFASIILSLFLMCMSGQKYGHYGMVLCPLVVYVVSRIFSYIAFHSSIWEKRKFHAVFFTVLVFILLLFAKSLFYMITSIPIIIHGHDLLKEERKISHIIQENTNNDDLISICGNYNIIYLLSDRKSVSKYSYQSPIALINPQIKNEYLDDLKTLKPSVIVVNHDCFMFNEIYNIMGKDYGNVFGNKLRAVYLKKKI